MNHIPEIQFIDDSWINLTMLKFLRLCCVIIAVPLVLSISDKGKFGNLKEVIGDDDSDLRVRVLGEIVKKYFNFKTVMMNIITAESNRARKLKIYDMISNFSKNYATNITTTIEESQALRRTRRSKKYNIFFVATFESWKMIQNKIHPRIFDYRGYFIIVITDEINKKELENILSDFWTLYIVNVNVILKMRGESFVSSYSYFPFTMKSCEDSKPRLLETYHEQVEFDNPTKNLFSNKMKNLYGCPLTAATFHVAPFMIIEKSTQNNYKLRGVEGFLLNIIAEKMNFTLMPTILSRQSMGTIDMDGQSSGAISMVMNREVNFTIGSHSYSPTKSYFMSASYTYFPTILTWFFSASDEISSLQRLAVIFDIPTWIIMTVVFSISIIVIVIIKYQKDKVRGFVFGEKNRQPMMNYAIILFGYSISRPPRRNFARNILMVFIIYTMIMRSAYTGAMYSFMRKDLKVDKIERIKDLVDRQYVFLSPESYREHFIHSNSTSVVFLGDMQVKESVKKNFIFARTKGLAFALLEEMVSYINDKVLLGENMLTVCPEKISTLNLCIYSQKESIALIREMNRYIIDIQATGLLEKVRDDYLDGKFNILRRTLSSEPKKLEMRHLLGGFYLYLMGISIAAAALFLELFFHRVRTIEASKISKINVGHASEA